VVNDSAIVADLRRAGFSERTDYEAHTTIWELVRAGQLYDQTPSGGAK
jgi:hypothetical protein